MEKEFNIFDLEDMIFKNERLEALVGILQLLISKDKLVEVRGTAENAVGFSLYEIQMGLRENNENLRVFLEEGIKNRR
ncbi:MAG TPA: hypothetical protein IAA26_12625 [Candidatus Blautia faecipullorum]|nr:hypothetical protein [Candidatus Blautia faecipullorum]